MKNLIHVTAVCLVVLLFLSEKDIRAQGEANTSELIELAECEIRGLNFKARCGNLDVWEDRKLKKGRKIGLNIVVLPAQGGERQSDPLVVLVGGPGQAATQGAVAQARRFAEILKSRDILLVDQRGTGNSNRLQCDLGGLNGAFHTFVKGEFRANKARECRKVLEKSADLNLYSTEAAMDDLDKVRQLLGYDKLNLYGGSYGTRPAMVYLKRHPDSVRTVTVRGVYSMNPQYFARDTQNALSLLFEDCAKSEKCSAVYPNLSSRLDSLLERLRKDPGIVVAAEPGTGSKFEIEVDDRLFVGLLRRMLYDSGSQARIPLLIKKAEVRNFQPVEDVVAQTKGLLSGFSIGMFMSVACPEGISRLDPLEIKTAASGSVFGSHMAESVLKSCKEWTPGRLSDGYFEPVRSDAPVLILSGEADPVTPPIWGDQIAQYLPNSLHLRMKGIAHSPFPGCALRIMDKFVSSGAVDELDTKCIADIERIPYVGPNRVRKFDTSFFLPGVKPIIEAELAWLKLSAAGDRKRLERYLPDDYRQVAEKGKENDNASKHEWIKRVLGLSTRVGDGVFSLINPAVKVEGDTAIVNAGWSLSGSLNGRPVSTTINISDTWTKRNGKWVVTSRTIRR